jgi:hypothetical protein
MSLFVEQPDWLDRRFYEKMRPVGSGRCTRDAAAGGLLVMLFEPAESSARGRRRPTVATVGNDTRSGALDGDSVTDRRDY